MILNTGAGSSSPYTSFYAIVPARAGSKGLPNKNKRRLSGLPLAEHSLVFASSLRLFNGIVCSTDCDFLLSRSHLYPDVLYHTRPSQFASDTSSLSEVILDIYECGLIPDPGSNPAFALLQPTSPFRSYVEFRDSIGYSLSLYPESLVLVSNVNHHPSEYITFGDGLWKHVLPPPSGLSRRQDYSQTPYFISGSLYVSTLRSLKSHLSFVHDDTTFWLSKDPFSVDIDTPFDFALASSVYELMFSYGYAVDVSGLPCRHLQ